MTHTHDALGVAGDAADSPRASSCDHPADHVLEAFCPACAHPVDAVCPSCRGNVEASGAALGGAGLPMGLTLGTHWWQDVFFRL